MVPDSTTAICLCIVVGALATRFDGIQVCACICQANRMGVGACHQACSARVSHCSVELAIAGCAARKLAAIALVVCVAGIQKADTRERCISVTAKVPVHGLTNA